MNSGHFYFLSNDYFADFQDDALMQNHETVNNEKHDRPCFYAFKDDILDIFWMIPISSKVDKYKAIYTKKINAGRSCDTIVFGKVLGHEKAFLIQNMCPANDKYITAEYLDKNAVPVRIDYNLEKELITKAKKVLALHKSGIRLIFTNIEFITEKLKNNDI